METVHIIMLSLVGLVIISFIVIVVLKKLKGDIKISLNKTSFSSGEIINGNISVIAKKEIEVNRIYVKLIGKKKHKSRSTDGKTSSSWRIIYQNEIPLEGQTILQSNSNKSYNFNLKAPTRSDIGGPSINNEFINNAIKAIQTFSGERYKWHIEAIADAKGLDLTKKKSIFINLSNNDSSSNYNNPNMMQN